MTTEWRWVRDGSVFEAPLTSRTFVKERTERLVVAETQEEILEEVAKVIHNFPGWEVGITVEAGEIYAYDDRLWEVLQSHTTQADWPPDITASLFAEHTPEGLIVKWEQPTGAHDAYDEGDLELYEGGIYESLIDANVWSPLDYPQGWKEKE